MAKRRKNIVNEVLDRASDVGRDSRDLTRRALTGKKKKKGKKSTRKMVKRNNRAIEALVTQLDQYMRHDRAREKNSSVVG